MDNPKLVPELLCSDISVSLNFYIGILGFHISFERPEDRFAYLDIDGAHLMLEQATEELGQDRTWWTAKPEQPYGRGINLQIEVANVLRLYKSLQKSRYQIGRASCRERV